MGADFWWQFMNKRIVDRVHRGPKRVVFLLQLDNLFFQLLDLTSDVCSLFACGARASFQHSTGDRQVLGIDSFTTAAQPWFFHRILDGRGWNKSNEMIYIGTYLRFQKTYQIEGI